MSQFVKKIFAFIFLIRSENRHGHVDSLAPTACKGAFPPVLLQSGTKN
jgi:hypothetical protein